ncbi:hypothetical protein A2Y85_08045 [candidate division WOR-3 bacterium RBG_13_43_14]|uniref:Uncharacterized protein n=1 Tax=candidate division WOR-3 bacterium RBG_13_43_14 TaxID=1802590 RepID=A0A1F4U1S6_UNCW3|nr:MAG: hypothetical protein A2Y85_08045 [candidate division WOR-3 bacterium RBG_13_43_14]
MKKLVLSLALVLLIIGCGGEKAVFPLTVGNEWTYGLSVITETTDTSGVVADTMTATTTSQINSETTLDDSTAAFENISSMEYDDTLMTDFTDTSYVVETDDYILGYDSKSDTEPDTLFVLPVEEGNTWAQNSTTTAVVLGKEDVTVPAGTYNDCWEIGYITTGETTYTYYAPGTGNVKSYLVIGDTLTTVETTTELESVTIE